MSDPLRPGTGWRAFIIALALALFFLVAFAVLMTAVQ